jgi:hypothetical protein
MLRGPEGPLPRTEVRGFHRGNGEERSRCSLAGLKPSLYKVSGEAFGCEESNEFSLLWRRPAHWQPKDGEMNLPLQNACKVST